MELQRLWCDETAEVVLSRWDGDRYPAERDGFTQTAVIEFMRTGSYCRRLRRGDVLVDPNQVAFFNPQDSFQISHPCGNRNTGLSLRLFPDLLDTALADFGHGAPAGGSRPFQTTAAISSPRCHLLQVRLVGMLLNKSPADSLCVEELLLDLIREALAVGCRPRSAADVVQSNHACGRDRDRVEAIRGYLNAHWMERLTLPTLAKHAGVSRWHLATRFRAWVGLPIHRYLTRLRLRHALAGLQDGCSDMTRLAVNCGFSSHSHFSMAFRQEFGVTPSLVRSSFPGLSQT